MSKNHVCCLLTSVKEYFVGVGEIEVVHQLNLALKN